MKRGTTRARSPRRTGATLTYLGAAGWQLKYNKTVVLFDPYLSRIRYTGKPFGIGTSPSAEGDSRPVYGPDDIPESDRAVIDAHITRAHYILVSHSHFNHCMDTPYIAAKTGAIVVGSESTTNTARAYGVPPDRLVTVRGGEDYAFEDISIKVIPSLHSALNGKRYFQSGVVPRDVHAPLRLRDYVEGGTLAYLVRFGSLQILLFGSMNYIERELEGLRPDVVLLAAARPRREIYDYTGRAMRALGFPRTVIATHCDTQAVPYGPPQDATYREAQQFVRELKAASPRTKVFVPRHFDTYVVGAGRRVIAHPRTAFPTPGMEGQK